MLTYRAIMAAGYLTRPLTDLVLVDDGAGGYEWASADPAAPTTYGLVDDGMGGYEWSDAPAYVLGPDFNWKED